MPDAVPDHAEYRRDQCPDILQRCEHGKQKHRTGLDQDVPAEHKRLHLERPGGEQIGRPLKTIVADVEWRERGSPRGSAQDAMTRFTSFPALFLGSFGTASLSGNVATTTPVSTARGMFDDAVVRDERRVGECPMLAEAWKWRDYASRLEFPTSGALRGRKRDA